jgi:hypothetical protein
VSEKEQVEALKLLKAWLEHSQAMVLVPGGELDRLREKTDQFLKTEAPESHGQRRS